QDRLPTGDRRLQYAGSTHEKLCAKLEFLLSLAWLFIHKQYPNQEGDQVLILFGDCTLDLERRELSRKSSVVSTAPKVFDLLVYLAQNAQRVVTRDELLTAVWAGRIVSESTLASHINAARKAVGDNGQKQYAIRTIARKGYRFVAEI